MEGRQKRDLDDTTSTIDVASLNNVVICVVSYIIAHIVLHAMLCIFVISNLCVLSIVKTWYICDFNCPLGFALTHQDLRCYTVVIDVK